MRGGQRKHQSGGYAGRRALHQKHDIQAFVAKLARKIRLHLGSTGNVPKSGGDTHQAWRAVVVEGAQLGHLGQQCSGAHVHLAAQDAQGAQGLRPACSGAAEALALPAARQVFQVQHLQARAALQQAGDEGAPDARKVGEAQACEAGREERQARKASVRDGGGVLLSKGNASAVSSPALAGKA